MSLPCSLLGSFGPGITKISEPWEELEVSGRSKVKFPNLLKSCIFSCLHSTQLSLHTVKNNVFCRSHFYILTSSSSLHGVSKHHIQDHDLIEELGNLNLLGTVHFLLLNPEKVIWPSGLPSPGVHINWITSKISHGTRSSVAVTWQKKEWLVLVSI